MLAAGSVRQILSNTFPFLRLSHPFAAALGVGAVAVAIVVWRVVRRAHPDPDALEEARRQRLARAGRLTDGNLVDTATIDGRYLTDEDRPRRVLQYRYRVAGVGYEAVQDVSTIESLVHGLRVDLPIQVRYDQENPADSIVVSEEWCGLRYASGDERRRSSV